MPSARKPQFFKTPAEFRAWLLKHHATAAELLVGFYKKGSGKPSITWPESVDEALCVGWIDGIRRRIDDDRYSIRFTPRRSGSIWSAVNTKRVAVLMRDGRMLDAGLAAFKARDAKKTAIYSYERATAAFPPAFERQFRANATAWSHFTAAPPSYRRLAAYWVTTAKQQETRQRRMALLIESWEKGEMPKAHQVAKSYHAGRKRS